MITVFLFFILFLALVVLQLVAQRWVFKRFDERDNPEWELCRQCH
jgi:hypothetical protein